MYKLSKLILIFLLLFIVLEAKETKDTMKWRVISWSPMYITKGEYTGQGIYDNIIKKLSDNLPQYTHSTIKMNTARVLKDMKNGKKICHPSVLKQSGISLMNSILIPHQIIMHKNAYEKLGNVKEYSIEKLLNDKSLVGGIVPNRYSKTINDIINNIKDKKHLNINANYESLINLLLKNRIDYIIEYAVVVNFRSKELNKNNLTVSIDISDSGQDKFLPVYTKCPDNEWGKLLISRINKILIEESKEDNFLDSRIRWYNDDDKKALTNIYKEYYFVDKK